MEQTAADRRPLSVLHLLSFSFMITTTTIHSFISFSLSESSSGVCNNNDDFCCRCFCTTDWKNFVFLFYSSYANERIQHELLLLIKFYHHALSLWNFVLISEIIINSSDVIIILRKSFFLKKTKFSAASARSCHLCVGCPRFFVAAALFSLLVVFAFLIWFSSSFHPKTSTFFPPW